MAENTQTTEVLTMYRNIRKLPQLTASTIVLFCELDYLIRRVPDLQITRTVLARRLNMHTDTVTRGLNTLMQQNVIHFEADFRSGTIHSIVVNPKNLY